LKYHVVTFGWAYVSTLLRVIVLCMMIHPPLMMAKDNSRNGADTTVSEYWVSQSKTGTVILMLNGHGQAEYIEFSRRPDKTSYFAHEPQAKWGVRPAISHLTVPVRTPQKPVKAVRDFWVKTSKYRFDFLEGGGRVYEVDKMGVQRVFQKVENKP
jgi:hypothetical protein